MTEANVTVPSGWHRRSEETRRDSSLLEVTHETAAGTTFVVAVFQHQGDASEYELRLSTVNPTSKQVRHDYPVEQYAALDGAESLLDYLSRRLQEDDVSRANPSVREVQTLIDEFTGERPFPSIRRLARRVRSVLRGRRRR